MSKEKVYIVLSHKHTLKGKSRTEWQTTENIEIVNQLRNKHYTMSSAIADYLGRTMITGSRNGMEDYDKFENYIMVKYPDQISKLDVAYKSLQVPKVTINDGMITDSFGVRRPTTVFDVDII